MGDEPKLKEKLEESNDLTNKCKILIIGAGVAGLSAANHLVKNGCTDFRILEARGRIGGRVISIPIGHQRVELGANWIHGVLGNPMFELAIANGLIDIINVPKPHKVIAATEQGKQVPFGILQEIYEAYVCFLRRCEEYFYCQYLPPDDINSVGEHINLEASIYLNNIPESEEKRMRRLIFECLLKRETCISGCHSMDEIDLLELGSYTELQGGNIVLPTGYSSILQPLSKHIPPNNILTSHPVKVINWCNAVSPGAMSSPGADSGIDDPGNESDDSDKTVIDDSPNASPTRLNAKRKDFKEESDESTSPKKYMIEVECEEGKKFFADHLICTMPLGVLKETASTMFVPSLPHDKIEAIDRLLFGTVDKIFLHYDRPFLNPTISEVMLLWEPIDDQADIKRNWFRKIYSFSKVSETLLLGWISGREAEHMETLPMETVAAKCTEILRKFLNDPFVPEPQKCVCTSWHKQPYSKGSYTSIAVGASQLDIEQISRPCFADPQQQKPTLLFAGEHTHSNFYSTVHGAYLSGRTAAQQVLIPDARQEIVMDCNETSDLSSWIQGMSLQ